MLNKDWLIKSRLAMRQLPITEFFMLDNALDTVALQRDRVIAAIYLAQSAREYQMEQLRSDSSLFGRLHERAQNLHWKMFTELNFYFIAWGSIYRLLWHGDNLKNGKRCPSIVDILKDDKFNVVIGSYKEIVHEYYKRRNDIEHVLARIHEGVQDLGNLQFSGNKRTFTYDKRPIDISDSAFGLVEQLAESIEQWITTLEPKLNVIQVLADEQKK
ncbi:MAG: hypothetical protein A3A97_01195 [Candidatus Terrybacteria bacterium RIFCSPLOWO2_01_FULL_40_23]|uniref:Uncharacterized protein n=1 Tax=Candidatus Terrybacteria bacterium RIFCSPLOWO2_01_FULL_40_23 TaxID=1802366 RepID=A0A1G2PWP4_9BACT|nr:MAG: hypothetical protein A3A97_01195 [Candidatus Terrybacteria bacterium RIFCSPLOWO2_01_FULL_40_23]